MTMLVSRAFK